MQDDWYSSVNCDIPFRMNNTTNENRIIELETTIAHHEQEIEQMSEVITDQYKMIQDLNSKVEKLFRKMDRLENGEEGEAEQVLSGMDFARQNKPPHY